MASGVEKPQGEAEQVGRKSTNRSELDAALEELRAPRDLQRGEIIEGIVAAITDEGVAVDVGAKFEGLIPRAEFARDDEMPRVGERIMVAVAHVDEDEGVIRLSKKRADYEQLWTRLEEGARSGAVITAPVIDRVRGGLRVDLGMGVFGFVPASQVAVRDPRALDRLVGQDLRLRVLEADRRQKKVVLSHRVVVEEERERRRHETLSKLYEGAVVEGRVRSITDYGAFIDLGGVDGLLHVSELSWVRVNHPSEILRRGQRVRVMVMSIDPENERISLSRRLLLPDPWATVAQEVKPGDVVKVLITRLVRTGAFGRLLGIEDAELEGFIPLRELSTRPVSDPKDVVSPGQTVDAKVLELRPESRRMTLSIAEVEQDREREEYRRIMQERRADEPRRTLGDALLAAGIVPPQDVENSPAETEGDDTT
ncbi:MAG: S1 RNA-binding domain-containing protein [Armatimonadetes bacterium]|nr:S1 RNA-binding domain-containing protein [Armatimonadota bacterium]